MQNDMAQALVGPPGPPPKDLPVLLLRLYNQDLHKRRNLHTYHILMHRSHNQVVQVTALTIQGGPCTNQAMRVMQRQWDLQRRILHLTS